MLLHILALCCVATCMAAPELAGTPEKPLAEHARAPLEGGGVFKTLKWPENLSKPAKEAAAKLAQAEGRLPAVKPINLEGPVALKPGGELPVLPKGN